MQCVYTNANPMLVQLAADKLKVEGINVELRNEFALGATGELAPIDTWLEAWVGEDDFSKAKTIVNALDEKGGKGTAWICSNCGEENDANFEICWKCET